MTKVIHTMANGTEVLVDSDVEVFNASPAIVEHHCPQCGRAVNPGHALDLRIIDMHNDQYGSDVDLRCALCRLTPELHRKGDWDTGADIAGLEFGLGHVQSNGSVHDPEEARYDNCHCEDCQWHMAEDLRFWESWHQHAQQQNMLCELVQANSAMYPGIDPATDLPWIEEPPKPPVVEQIESLVEQLKQLPSCESCNTQMEAFLFYPIQDDEEDFDQHLPGTSPRGRVAMYNQDAAIFGGAQIICARDYTQAQNYAVNRRVNCDIFTLGHSGWRMLKRDKRHQ